ncbi:hypothetical protein DIPPA_29230 [Diplonema papillatum]|nr:hypothetical protein DIPPA_29230 [Diplonema papillatum]
MRQAGAEPQAPSCKHCGSGDTEAENHVFWVCEAYSHIWRREAHAGLMAANRADWPRCTLEHGVVVPENAHFSRRLQEMMAEILAERAGLEARGWVARNPTTPWSRADAMPAEKLDHPFARIAPAWAWERNKAWGLPTFYALVAWLSDMEWTENGQASMLELAIDFELFSGLSIPLHENAPKGVRERGNVLRCMISALDKLATQQGLGSCERGERVCPTTSLSFMGISGISGVRPRPRFREAHTGTILEEQVKGSDVGTQCPTYPDWTAERAARWALPVPPQLHPDPVHMPGVGVEKALVTCATHHKGKCEACRALVRRDVPTVEMCCRHHHHADDGQPIAVCVEHSTTKCGECKTAAACCRSGHHACRTHGRGTCQECRRLPTLTQRRPAACCRRGHHQPNEPNAPATPGHSKKKKRPLSPTQVGVQRETPAGKRAAQAPPAVAKQKTATTGRAAKRPPPTPGTGERPALKKRVLGTPKESPIAGRKRKKAKATTPESGVQRRKRKALKASSYQKRVNGGGLQIRAGADVATVVAKFGGKPTDRVCMRHCAGRCGPGKRCAAGLHIDRDFNGNGSSSAGGPQAEACRDGRCVDNLGQPLASSLFGELAARSPGPATLAPVEQALNLVSATKLELLQQFVNDACKGASRPLGIQRAWQLKNDGLAWKFRCTEHNFARRDGAAPDVIDGFHGTSEANVLSIATTGFDPFRRSGQVYGAGEYFAQDPHVSVGYCAGGSFMFICKLILGTAGVDHDWIPSTKYYIMKQNEGNVQALPMYLIQYQTGAPGSPLLAKLAEFKCAEHHAEEIFNRMGQRQRGGVLPEKGRVDGGMSAAATKCLWVGWIDRDLGKQSDEQLDRSGAVSWVKRVVGTDVPSLFSFTANNRRLSTVLKVAREVEGTAEAGLRRLLGALGYTDEEAPPEGVAQWVLAWLAVASAPSATEGEFADLLRSSPKAAPPPQTPGHMPLPATPTDSTAALSPPAARRVSFAESDDPDDGDLRDCGSTEGSRGGDSDRMDRLQRQVERLTELVMAALPTRDSPRPEPVPAATTHPARDAPPGCPAPPPVAMPVGSFPAAAATPLDSCPCPAPRQGPLAGQLPPPPPLIDVSRLPRAVLLPGSSCGLLRAIEDAAPPVYRHHPYAELYQPRAEPPQPYAGSSQPLPDFPEGPPSLGEGGSVQGSPTLLSPGPELLDPQLWVGLSPIEKSLALVHIRDFFADILDAIPSVANDAQHLTNHVTTIMRLMDDTTDPDALVQLGRDTIHRMMVLKTALKAGWSLAGSLQHRHQHEAGFPPFLRSVFQALQKAEEQPASKPPRKRSPRPRTRHSGEALPPDAPQAPQRTNATRSKAKQ